jgi:hypothetical protein
MSTTESGEETADSDRRSAIAGAAAAEGGFALVMGAAMILAQGLF